MTNPFLKDTVERVGRDPRRKLGWEDRLVGTMRLALSQGVVPRRYAFGAAAALFVLDPRALEPETPLAPLLSPLWQDAPRTQEEEAQVLRLLEDARIHLRAWRRAGGPDLAGFWGGKT
jgi:mannitol-1-phosphate 5-dehydrogenase